MTTIDKFLIYDERNLILVFHYKNNNKEKIFVPYIIEEQKNKNSFEPMYNFLYFLEESYYLILKKQINKKNIERYFVCHHKFGIEESIALYNSFVNKYLQIEFLDLEQLLGLNDLKINRLDLEKYDCQKVYSLKKGKIIC